MQIFNRIYRFAFAIALMHALIGCGAEDDTMLSGVGGKADNEYETKIAIGETFRGTIAVGGTQARARLSFRKGDTIRFDVRGSVPMTVRMDLRLSYGSYGTREGDLFKMAKTASTYVYFDQGEWLKKETQFQVHAVCVAGPCATDPDGKDWRDDAEPNDTKQTAHDGTNFDVRPFIDFMGWVAFHNMSLTPGDVDWYQIDAKDSNWSHDPAVYVSISSDAKPHSWEDKPAFFQVTIYSECNSGNSRPICPMGQRIHDGGGRGCRGVDPHPPSTGFVPTLSLLTDCRGTLNESGKIWVKVETVRPITESVRYTLTIAGKSADWLYPD